MKTILSILIALISISAFAEQENAKMVQSDPDSVKTEISKAVSIIFRNLEKMDAEVLFQSYSNTSDFTFITTSGSKVSFQEAKNHHFAWFNSISSLKVTKLDENIRILADENVLCSWLGSFEISTSDGANLIIENFGTTFIFRKTENSWKVFYQHSSALPPVSNNKQ